MENLNVEFSKMPLSLIDNEFFEELYNFRPAIINVYTRVQNTVKSCLGFICLKKSCTHYKKFVPLVVRTDITQHVIIKVKIVFPNKMKSSDTNRYMEHMNYEELTAQLLELF